MIRRAAAVVSMALCSCAPEPEVLPPLGEVLVSVDTDAPVPRLVSRLRIDIYSEEGEWIDSRDQLMASRGSWPGSFSLFIDEDTAERAALVRLRAYSRTRDYRGERFLARPEGIAPETIVEPPEGDGEPRLIVDGEDLTPRREPLPELTIDRLLRVRLQREVRATAQVTLRTQCVGTMADLRGRTTCVDAENQRLPLTDAALEEGIRITSQSIGEGPLSQPVPCSGSPRDDSGVYDAERCVEGGLFVVGDDALFAGAPASEAEVLTSSDSAIQLNAFPQRVAVMTPFFMDEHEVTVGRWRRAIAEGFVGGVGEAIANEGPIMQGGADQTPECTWSTTPQGREDYPLNCVSWVAAQAFCEFYGGRLPTETQWEYAASRSPEGIGSIYPWGDEGPTCERAVHARAPGFAGLDKCLHLGFGPQPVELSLQDISGDGVIGLAGGLAEWQLDVYRSYSSACWRSAPLVNPSCLQSPPVARSKRGASWGSNNVTEAAWRGGTKSTFVISLLGFRCIREAA